jgi:hypothetical protein
MVVHTCHPSPWEAGAGEFEASMVYIVRLCSSKQAKTARHFAMKHNFIFFVEIMH